MSESRSDERRSGADRRDGTDRRAGRDRRHPTDRRTARRLPDDFAQAAGGPRDRIVGLVNRYWGGTGQQSRDQLADALVPVLEELATPGAPVTEGHRQRCEEVVVDWLNGELDVVSTK